MNRSLLGAGGAGLGGGCVGGAIAGAAEGAWVLAHAGGSETVGVIAYAVALYGAIGAAAGFALGLLVEALARVARRPAGDGTVHALPGGLVLAAMAGVAWRFLVRRDIFSEHLAWGSTAGMAIQAAIGAAALLVVFLSWRVVARSLDRSGKKLLAGPWFGPLLVALAAGGLWGWAHYAATPAPGERARGAAGGKKAGGPNVLLVMADTLRADHVDPYGARGMTPSLASLAAEGVTFTHAYAQASWTRPSVASVLSGRYPSSHRATGKMDTLSPDVLTIGELLQKEGYDTAAVVTNYVNSAYFGFGQGFDEYIYLEPEYFLRASDATSKLVFYELLKAAWSKYVAKGSRPGAHYRDARIATDRAIEWLDARKDGGAGGRKFFMFLQYMDPHDPYFAHPDDGKAVARKATPNPPPGWLGRIKELYAGEVRHFDRHFGRLLAHLRAQPRWKETLVVFFSDHGEEFLEHGGWWHGDTLFEEQLRVPLIVKLPGSEAAGTKVDGRLVELVDVAPTIARLCGAPVPGAFQGKDLFEETAQQSAFAEEDHAGNVLKALVFKSGGAPWKVITAGKGNPRQAPPTSLFDLGADPGEQKNLASTGAKETEAALGKLAARAADAAKGAVRRTSIELDEKAKEHLTNLGYIKE